MAQSTFELTGDVNVRVTVTELDDGALQFDLVVLDDTGSIGDLNGLFFDISDDALVDGLMVSGDDITDSAFNANKVTKVDGYNNINGEVAGEFGKFDGGVQFGTSGIGVDDIRETSFVLSHDSADLTLDMILSQDFAVRLTSVGEEGGSREDSLKIGGEAPDQPDSPPVDDPDTDGPPPDGPPLDDPDIDGPSPDGPSLDDPDIDGPSPDGPSLDDPDIDGPSPDGPSLDDPDIDGPTPDEPPLDEPDVDSPPSDGPPPDGPSLDDPVIDDDEFILTPGELDALDPMTDLDDLEPTVEEDVTTSTDAPPDDFLSPEDFIGPVDDGGFG